VVYPDNDSPRLLGGAFHGSCLAQLSEGGAEVAYWKKRPAVNGETLGSIPTLGTRPTSKASSK
jgi:hypothetical protein